MGLKKLLLTGLLNIISLFCFCHAGTTVADSIFSGTMYRKFRLYVPPIYTGATAVPLILNLHGYTSNAIQQQVYSNFMPIADTANFLMVYPDGTAPFGSPFWNAGITNSPDDVLFMSDLIDSLHLLYNIDPKRVYSCGMSNGAIMSYYLACNLSGRITAIASVAGTLFNSWFSSCTASRPVPVMEIHGTADATVPYAGDTTFAPVDSVVRKWVHHNSCYPLPLVDTLANASTTDNSFVIHSVYSNGASGSSVELYKVIGGSHSWPGSIPVFSNTNEDFNASLEIWRFFRQYSLDQVTPPLGIKNEPAPGSRPKVFPNPASGSIRVEGITGGSLSIFRMDGSQVMEESCCRELDVSSLPAGMYLIKVRKDQAVSVFRFIRL